MDQIRKTTTFAAAMATAALVMSAVSTVFADNNEQISQPLNGSIEKISEKGLLLDIHFHFHHRIKFVYNSEWPVEKRASELTGISLKNITRSDLTNGNEAFNLLIANGDLPDIVGGTGLRGKFNKFGPNGVFVPLNELIEEHAPHIDAYFKKNPDILSAISAGDGKLYHIPYVPDGKFARAYFIRTDWLDNLGLEPPGSVDELYDVLTAFKNDDPNGNGIADEIPYFSRNFPETIRLVTLWDARTTGTDKAHDFYVSDGNIRHGYIDENYKIGMINLAKWYREGLLDNEVYTRKGDIRKQLLSSDVGGMTHDWFASTSSYNDKLKDQVPGLKFYPMAPPRTVSGQQFEENRRIAVRSDGWGITTKNKHVVETIKYFDFWFTPEGRRLANFGVEGSEYNLVDGQPVFTDDVLNGDQPVNSRLWSVGAQIPRGFLQDYEYEKQWTNKIALAGIEMYERGGFLLEPFHGVTLNEQEKEVKDFYWSEILSFMLERQEEWLTGLRDIEKDWDSYLNRLDKLGMQKVLKAKQSAYDRQYKTNQKAELD